MKFLAAIGGVAVERVRRTLYAVAVATAVLAAAMRPRTWRRTIREVLARQVLFSGIEAAGFTSRIAFLVGVSVVVQVQLWLAKVGQSRLIGPILVAVVIRELGPLLANLVAIGRSGNVFAAELGNMTVFGEVRLLDAQGVDPFLYLVLPRVLGLGISVFCLTIVFILVALLSGYVMGVLLGAKTGGPGGYVDSVVSSLGPADLLNVLVKSLLPALLSAAICCTEGLSVGNTVTDVAPAAARAVQRSVVALFVISAIVSLLTYL